MRRMAMGLALLGATAVAQAEIYVCEDNGKKTFSQKPCGSNAKPVILQQAGGRITLPEVFDDRAASDICKVMTRSWEVAAQMRRQNIAQERAYQRIFDYLRESVVNFDESVKRGPYLFTAFQQASRRLVSDAYANPNIVSGEREVAIQQCTESIIRDLERAKSKSTSKRGAAQSMSM